MLISTLGILLHIQSMILIFCRIFFALQVLPIMEETKLPAAARVGLSMILSLIAYYTVALPSEQYSIDVLTFFILIMKECMVGLILGFGVSLFFQLYHFVGYLLSTQGGLGMSNLFDPASGMQVPLLGRFYYLGFCVIFMVSGGYHWFITAIIETFKAIPLTQAVFKEDLVFAVIHAVGVFWELSFKLASPIIAIIFIVDCGLGILARTVPQMNMFVIGLPLKVFILFMLLIVTIGLLPAYNDVIMNQITGFFYSLIQGMMP